MNTDKETNGVNGCDCEDKSQCWEPCGELGHDEKYAVAVPESEVPWFLRKQAD